MTGNEAKPKNEPIKRALLDTDHVYTADELQNIIDGEFAGDTDSVDMELIDLATARLLALTGKPLTLENLYGVQEENVKRILSRALGIDGKPAYPSVNHQASRCEAPDVSHRTI